MPGIVAIVSAISDDVVAALAAGGYPALTDGKVLLGAEHVAEASAPPRVVFVPATSRWAAKQVYGPAKVQGYPSANERLKVQERALLTETFTYRVHVWGQASPPDPAADYDATQVLYQQVVRSIHLLAPGNYTLEPGVWTDSTPRGSQMVRAGREFVFHVSFGTPVLDQLLPYAPADTAAHPTVKLDVGDGTPESA